MDGCRVEGLSVGVGNLDVHDFCGGQPNHYQSILNFPFADYQNYAGLVTKNMDYFIQKNRANIYF